MEAIWMNNNAGLLNVLRKAEKELEVNKSALNLALEKNNMLYGLLSTIRRLLSEDCSHSKTSIVPALKNVNKNSLPEILPISEQVKALKGLFPEINAGPALTYAESINALPMADGLIAVLKHKKISSIYHEAVGLVFAKLALVRGFKNFREGGIDNRLRQKQDTSMFLSELEQKQRGDLLVIPIKLNGSNEQGYWLGTFALGCFFLTHQHLLVSKNEPRFNCLGDEYDHDFSGTFKEVPYFSSLKKQLRFGTYPSRGYIQSYIHQTRRGSFSPILLI